MARDKTLHKQFVPTADITAYELAYILSRATLSTEGLSGTIIFTEKRWNKDLPEQIKKHFADVKNDTFLGG